MLTFPIYSHRGSPRRRPMIFASPHPLRMDGWQRMEQFRFRYCIKFLQLSNTRFLWAMLWKRSATYIGIHGPRKPSSWLAWWSCSSESISDRPYSSATFSWRQTELDLVYFGLHLPLYLRSIPSLELYVYLLRLMSSLSSMCTFYCWASVLGFIYIR